MAARRLPNIEEFFDSYYLIDGFNHLDVEDDRSDYFSRRIEDYEQTLRILPARLREAEITRTTYPDFWILGTAHYLLYYLLPEEKLGGLQKNLTVKGGFENMSMFNSN